MVVLRADPWSPDYGMGFQATQEEVEARADPTVETGDWSMPRSPTPAPPCPLWFVDGVRRVELRLVADEDGRRAFGLFGSFAVGSVLCDGHAAFGEHRVRRAVVLGSGMQPEGAEVSVGADVMTFEPASDPGPDIDRPLWRLQQLMREAEANLASRLAVSEGQVVLVDGPLGFLDPTRAPIVGVVKRFAKHYLAAGEAALLARLEPRQRTPLFALGDDQQPVQRYAWYIRLAPMRAPWHDHAGIARCEVAAGIGLEPATAIADRTAWTLPTFAGRAADPRTPQNLAPVAALETWLRHRMGHPGMVRRALLEWLTTKEG